MRLFIISLIIALSNLAWAQTFPNRPNAYTTDSLRHGEWVTFYDSLGTEVSRESADIFHYCLMDIKNGKPLNQVECFYNDGIRSWTGRLVTIDPEIKQGRALGFHKNGTLWNKGFYENDTLQGLYQSFYPNGILESEGQMTYNQKVGDWIYFYNNGNAIGTINHVDGKENGFTSIYYQNGSINSKGKFINGTQQGYWETYYESGIMSNKGTYQKGLREGQWTYYHENGEIIETSVYKKDKQNGAYQKYFDNGQLESSGTYKNGLGEGHFEYFYNNGQLNAKGLINKDLYQGNWIYYYENGEKKSEGNYKDDLNEGLWKYYFDNGQLNREVNYKNGKSNGIVTYYYDQGQLNATGEFIEDQKHGTWKYFYDNGNLQGIETYQFGILHGPSSRKTYTDNLLSKGSYHNGKKQGYWEFYYENGGLSSSEEYNQDLTHGKRINYYENGNKKSEGKYRNNLREGNWIYYYSNGELSAVGEYKGGQSTGKWLYYYDNGNLLKEGEEYADTSLGEWLFYHRNGGLKSRGSYSEGQLHGAHFFYDATGRIESESEYFQGTQQTFSNLYDSVDHLSLNGNFEKAWLTLKQAEKVFTAEYGKDALKKSDLYELFGSYFSRKQEYNSALKYYKKSLKNTLKYKADTSSWYTSTLDDFADLFTAQNDYEKAYEIYLEVIDKIKARPNGKYSDEYAQSFRYLTLALMNLNRDEEAIKLLQQDLAFREKIPDQNTNMANIHFSIMDGLYPIISHELDSAIAQSFRFHEANNMQSHWSYPSTHYFQALVYRDKNQIDSAYKHFTACVAANISLNDTVSTEFVNSLIHIGNYHYNNLAYHLSRPYYNRAKLLSEKPKLKSSWVYESAIKALSNQYWVDDDYPNTLKYNELLIKLATKDNDILRIGQGYTGMGLAYDHMEGDHVKDARESHLKAIETLERTTDYNVHYVNANIHYATHLNNQDQPEESYQIYKNMERYISSQIQIDSFYLNRTYNHLAFHFYNQYAYDSAIFYNQKVINSLKNKPGKSMQQYLESYRMLGDIMSNLNKDESAITYYFKSLNETEKYLGKENEFYFYALLEIAESFSNQDNPPSSIKYYQEAIDLGTQIRNINYTLESRINLAEEYITAGNYDKAKTVLDFIKQTYESNGAVTSDGYTWCLRVLSRLHEVQDNFRTAEDLMLDALAIVEKNYASNSRDYATHLRRVGQFYLRNNDYEIAYQYVAPALKVVESTLGDDVILYAWYAETMSKILYGLDNYAEAVNLQEKAANIYLSQIGEEQDYMNAQYDLGELLAEIGQYENSIVALEESRNAVIKKYGRYSMPYTSDTREIAQTYLQWKKPNKALEELQTVSNLYDSMGVKRSLYASLNNYLGWAYLDLKEYKKAKIHYKTAIQIADSTWGKVSRAAKVYRNNLAFYYLEKGEFEEAERLWLETEDQFNTTDFSSVAWRDNMAMLYTSWDKLDKAASYWEFVRDQLMSKIKKDFPLLSESGKAAFWDAYKADFEIFNTYAIKASASGNKKALGQMYDNQMETKSLLLNTTTKERKRILNSGNKSLIATYNRYIELKEDLVKFYGYSTEELNNKNINLDALERQAESLEKALSINSFVEQTANEAGNTTWKSIQKNLLPDEAAIEIIRFRYFDRSLTDSVLYAALILTPETQSGPILEILPNGNYLEDRAIKAYRASMKFKQKDDLSYDAFWKPIERYLTDTKKIYLSSDGVYHQLNVATLQKEDGSFIGDNHEFRLVSSTRVMTEIKKKRRKNEAAIAYIFGNPKFDLSHSLIESDVHERGLVNNQSYTRATTFNSFSFAELPGTKEETETVNEVLVSENWKTNIFLEEEALEEELKRVDNPSLLHIATHGFFLEQPNEASSTIQLGIEKSARQKNPLLRSGLLMTGATQTAKGQQNNAIENGIFTAYEAMNLDLSSTELVVLSACETGLGEIKNGEGVFGLQRAFQIAGAKSILMSLWKVDDAATQLLMTSFYKAWLSGISETKALQKAQEIVKQSYPHPNYWGAFVLVGG